jgi:KDO2-lipid IV(A) lauroyltransferase
MLADQYPTNKDKQKKAVFFSTETAFLHGPENYSKQLNIPVVYVEVQRIKRGYYSITIKDMVSDSKNLAENELTQMYASLLEKSIINQPENWIWSHKRWKKELYAFD